MSECVFLRTKVGRWHISVVQTSVGGAAWGRRRERRRRERTGVEAGKMLRCVRVRLSTTQVRSRRLMEAWCRDRRDAGSVVQGPGQRGGGSQARGSLSDLCVFVGCSEFWRLCIALPTTLERIAATCNGLQAPNIHPK